jgi:hypothetical protein
MRATRGALRVGAAAVLLVAAACGVNQDLTGPGASSDVQTRQVSPSPTPDELDRSIPGFGGFFVDRNGIPTVYLVGAERRASAELVLEPFLRERGMRPERLRVLPAKFTHRQLEGWYQRATPDALDIPGAVFVDNDESTNRVRIGVQDLNADGRVRDALLRLGIPADAAIIERSDPIFMVASLQNIIDRPVRAGVQINFPGFVCSVGFNANAGSQRSFVTASHCTNTQGGVESTPYWQPTQTAAPGQIATEVADPSYFRGRGCPILRRCRYSDAARASYLNGNNQALGVIARTSGANNGSLEVVGSFNVVAEDQRDHFTTGEVIHKVGRTTGWTSGGVTGTCVNVSVSGTLIVQLCQTLVNSSGVIVGGGDSGSGVFQVVSGTNVRLAGILWGGNGAGTQFVFSPLRNVERELGALTTF